MRRCLLVLVMLVAFSAGPSVAQPIGDACWARLAEFGTKFIGKTINGQNRPCSESLVAIVRGDTAASIPVLEKKLLSSGLTLPRR
jgi:hypothetical protein